MRTKILMVIAVMVALVLTSCSKDDDKPSFKNVELTHGETYEIPSNSNAVWTSDNKLVAVVNGKTITGICEGTTKVSSSEGSFTVKVKTIYNNVAMPSRNWNASMATIRNEMSSIKIASELSDALLYYAPSPWSYYLYGFENGKLYLVSSMCTYSNFTTVANYLKERYYFVNMESVSSSVEVAGINANQDEMCAISISKFLGSYYYMFVFAKYTGEKLNSPMKVEPSSLAKMLTDNKISYLNSCETIPEKMKTQLTSEFN